MIQRAAAFTAALAALPDAAARLRRGLPELLRLLRDAVRAGAPPNPQYERERIIAQAPNPRELAFLLGYLSEGENETALLLELIAAVVAADAQAPIAHLVDESWYYLRTSIDENWQLDGGEPSITAALIYLFTVVAERIDRAQPAAAPLASDDRERASARRLLCGLRDTFA